MKKSTGLAAVPNAVRKVASSEAPKGSDMDTMRKSIVKQGRKREKRAAQAAKQRAGQVS